MEEFSAQIYEVETPFPRSAGNGRKDPLAACVVPERPLCPKIKISVGKWFLGSLLGPWIGFCTEAFLNLGTMFRKHRARIFPENSIFMSFHFILFPQTIALLY